MIRKEIQFTNFNDEKETGVFYFNMSKGELVMQQMSAIDQHTESFQDKLEKIAKNLQGKALVETLKEIIEDAYGEKTTDGKNFVKVRNGVKLVENFLSSGAYSELVVELLSSAQGMADFVNGLMPADLRDQVNQEVNRQQAAREKSQASLQGYQKKQEAAPKPMPVVSEPELPTVIEGTADPVFIDENPTPEVKVDPIASMSREELEAHFRNQQVSAQ